MRDGITSRSTWFVNVPVNMLPIKKGLTDHAQSLFRSPFLSTQNQNFLQMVHKFSGNSRLETEDFDKRCSDN